MAGSLGTTFRHVAGRSRRFAAGVGLSLLVLYVCSGLYSISENESGVLVRFGKVVDDKVDSGIHYALPWPIDRVYKVPVKLMHTLAVDDYSMTPGVETSAAAFSKATDLETYCISGDNNIVGMKCVLQYQVSNAADYLFRHKNPETSLRDLACATIIRCLARLPVDKILTYGKKEMEGYIGRELGLKLDDLQCGLQVSFVEIREIKPPGKVQKYFDDVVNSKIDMAKKINQAEYTRNERIPWAKADAYEMRQEAETYATQVTSRAEGETARFLETRKAYAGAKETTRKNMWLDCIREIMEVAGNVYVVDAKEGKPAAKIRIIP